MAFPVFHTANSATAYGKYNFSTLPYYHPGSLFRGEQPGAGEVYCAEAIGSPASITQSRDSPSSATRTLIVIGTYDENVAFDCVRGWLSLNNKRTELGIPLRSSSLTMDSSGAPKWECTLEYADPQNNNDNQFGEFCEVQMSTTGGTAHVSSSLLTLSAVSCVGEFPTPVNYCRLINVDKEGNSSGVDIKATTVHINVSLNWPSGVINPDYFVMLAELSPCVNSTYWFDNFAPGTLLFEGANVDRVTCTDPYDNSIYYRWKVSYSFLGEPNTVVTEPITWLTDSILPRQSVVAIPKRGWDYLWRSYSTAIVDGLPTNILRQVNVEKMYKYVDFASFGIPFSLFS